MNIVIKFCETILKWRETLRTAIRVFAALTALFCLNLPNFAQTCLEKRAKIEIQNVEVMVDNISEKGISSQIFALAKTTLSGFETGGKPYTLAINLSERSFYKNVESARSLYSHYQLFSESGECVLENVFCSESKNSILSALTQKRQIEKIAKDLKKFFAGAKENDA